MGWGIDRDDGRMVGDGFMHESDSIIQTTKTN